MTGMPSTTRPNTVYLLSSDGALPRQTKNDVCALPGSSPRAIERMPASCGVGLNSGGRLTTNGRCFCDSGAFRLVSAPVWTTKPGTTRWKAVPS